MKILYIIQDLNIIQYYNEEDKYIFMHFTNGSIKITLDRLEELRHTASLHGYEVHAI